MLEQDPTVLTKILENSLFSEAFPGLDQVARQDVIMIGLKKKR